MTQLMTRNVQYDLDYSVLHAVYKYSVTEKPLAGIYCYLILNGFIRYRSCYALLFIQHLQLGLFDLIRPEL